MPPPDISDVLLSDFGETVCNAQGICTFDLNNTDCDIDILPEPPLPPPGKLTSILFKNALNLNNGVIIKFVIYLCNHIYIGCIAGSRVPSPFDNCNTCLCGQDGSIEGCTRILCLEGTSLNVKV